MLNIRVICYVYWFFIWLSFPLHDDVIKWIHFPRYWPFVWGIHRSPVNSAHKGQRRGTLIFSLICAWINGWINNREAGDSRRHRAHTVPLTYCACLAGHWVVTAVFASFTPQKTSKEGTSKKPLNGRHFQLNKHLSYKLHYSFNPAWLIL